MTMEKQPATNPRRGVALLFVLLGAAASIGTDVLGRSSQQICGAGGAVRCLGSSAHSRRLLWLHRTARRWESFHGNESTYGHTNDFHLPGFSCDLRRRGIPDTPSETCGTISGDPSCNLGAHRAQYCGSEIPEQRKRRSDGSRCTGPNESSRIRKTTPWPTSSTGIGPAGSHLTARPCSRDTSLNAELSAAPD